MLATWITSQLVFDGEPDELETARDELRTAIGAVGLEGYDVEALVVVTTPRLKLHDILSLSITGHGTIDHVVNDVGAPTDNNTDPSDVVSYP